LYAYDVAWKPPINRQKNGNFLDDQRFYRLLSEKCNFIGEDISLVFYAGMVEVVRQELARHGVARLPHLGDFALVEQKSRPAWVGKVHARIGPRDVLKFYPKEKLRRYFSKRQGNPNVLRVIKLR